MTIRFFLISIFLCATFLTKGQGQELFRYADSLFATKNFLEASIEYERVIFNQSDNDLLNKAKYKKGLCYRHLSRYEDALDEVNRISLFNIADTMKTKVLYEKAFNSLLNENYQEALMHIKRINEEQLNQSTYNNILPLKILILNHSRNWEEAEKTFKQWIESLSYTQIEKENWKDSVTEFYSESNLPKNYSEEKARNLSRFIPGAGHSYAGHTFEGIGNFMLNGAAVGLGVHQIWHGFYFTGYIGGLGVFYKTYFGGMERAAYLANKEKDKEMAEFNVNCSRFVKKVLHYQSSSLNPKRK